MNPYVCFVGWPRSGTTLLRRIADAHSRLAVARGNRWLARTYEQRRGLTPEGLVTRRLVERLREQKLRERLALDVSDLERASGNGDGVAFAQFVTALYDRYGERHGKRLVGEKTPGYVRHMPTLHRLWPDARFVHLVRDGRDVHLSVLEWRKGAVGFPTFAVSPAMTTAVWWEWYVRLGLEAGADLPPGLYREMRYESLVSEPERECRLLCEFLEIDYEPRMVRSHDARARDVSQEDGGHPWRPITPGLRSWRDQMPRHDVVEFEAAAGDLLERLGYERLASSIPDRELERAARLRTELAREAASRGSPLPRAWAALAASTH